ncbi:DUF4357 domain-containing protein [Corynebacterium sp. sy017]|nr:DUF4357 domain-containing protein [Corynebacterium sp. sy017]TSD92090.1 DUF4357 domain-containing protein [Corynebacterium sp. SY003]
MPFNSPSGASNIALGRSTNGRTEWRNDLGQTYNAWESQAT